MPSIHRHIGISLLGCSFLLFTLWALPHMGALDTFHLATSAGPQMTVAPEHLRLESQIRALHTQYKAKGSGDGIAQLEADVLGTIAQLFADENPDTELLRGDAAYLLSIYAAARGKPCSDASMQKVCKSPAGGGAAQPDLSAAVEYAQEAVDFSDVGPAQWYAVYVAMLSGMGVLDPALDAMNAETGAFEGDTPVMAADMERWLYRIDTGTTLAKPESSPGVTVTKGQGVTYLTEHLRSAFEVRAARR